MRDYNIESDLKQEKFEVIKLVQGDKGNKLTINVLEDGKPVKLTGCSISAKYKRADGEVVNDGTIENITDNYFYAVMDSNITKVSGTLKMLFSIEKDDVKVSTFLLLADVREGIGESTGGGEVTVDLSNYYKKNETYSKAQIDSQFKDIANNQPTDLSLDSATNLLQLVNSKGSKLGNGITLPISSGGGTNQYLHIKYSSTGAPQLAGQISDTPNAYIGLCVDTNADSPINPKNYTWYNWKGDNGDTGATPNLQIGTVTTLESGSNATASITGTTENPVLNLGIPKGDKGDTETWEKVIETTFGEECYAFTLTQDKDGNALNLKEGIICVTVAQPTGTTRNLAYAIGFDDWASSFNGKSSVYNMQLMKDYEFYRASFYVKVINNYVFTQHLGFTIIGKKIPEYNALNKPTAFNSYTASNIRALPNNVEYVNKITIGLDMSTTGLFSKDCIMEVWAK